MPQSNSRRVKVTIDISKKEWIHIKMLAAKKKMTVSEFIMFCIRPNFPANKPNRETQKAMSDVDEKKNLTPCESIEKFWKVVNFDPNA